jgi:hypothetical protein
VATAEARGVRLDAVSDDEVGAALRSVDDEAAAGLAADPARGAADLIRSAASVEAALAAADVIGGTAPVRVRAALAAARERLGPG